MLATLALLGLATSPAELRAADGARGRTPAPDFALRSAAGPNVRLSEHRGDVVGHGPGQFHEQDLFTADFHQASVMTLYLLTSVNLKLRPKILRELKPGTRVVSHNFGMGEWKPDQSSSVDVDDISHEVYLWVIPANISGTWTWTMGKPAL